MRLSLVARVLAAVAVPAVAVGATLALRGPTAARARPAPAASESPTAPPPAVTTVTPAAPLLAPAVTPTPPAPVPPGARRVVLYGDSLAWEARGPFTAALAAAGITQVTTRTFGGTAICDWFGQMRADAAAIHPDAVVIEFSGNALTPCMKALDGSPLTTEAYFAKYLQDTETVRGIFPPATLLFLAGSPTTLRATLRHDPNALRLNRMYAVLSVGLAATRYIDAGAAVTRDGASTHTLPCLPEEPCTGGTDAAGTPVNVVRAPDGGHFCPVAPPAVRGVVATCPVYSSGAYRYGSAMATPVVAELLPTPSGAAPSGHGSAASAACASSAAATASPARPNATPTPSPPVENTYPPCASTAARTTASWRASAAGITSGAACHRRVDPSMSVNKNVTVPDGAPTPT
ncbi:MAG TPA: hypothetical protein VMU14_18490, partial [Acidimicrobiales bacterium]|nr:hypothetical protein [Acidimicrobiales bacterium]